MVANKLVATAVALAVLAVGPAAGAHAAPAWHGRASLNVQVQTFPALGTEMVRIDLTISPPLDGREGAYIVDRTAGLTLMSCEYGASCSAFEFIQIRDTRTFVGEIEVPPGGPVVEANRGITVKDGHLSATPPAAASAPPPARFGPNTPTSPPAAVQHKATLHPGSASRAPRPGGAWSVPFTDRHNQLMVACAIDGRAFTQCILDTGNQFSAVVPLSIWDTLGITPTRRFLAQGLTGSSSAYAGSGTISIGGHAVRTLITEDPSDNFDYPNIGLSTLQALCFHGDGAVAFDWHRGVVACVPG